jgi:hypothetical protein
LWNYGKFYFNTGLRKKRWKTVVVHHSPTIGSSVVVAISVSWPYERCQMELTDLPFHGSAAGARRASHSVCSLPHSLNLMKLIYFALGHHHMLRCEINGQNKTGPHELCWTKPFRWNELFVNLSFHSAPISIKFITV